MTVLLVVALALAVGALVPLTLSLRRARVELGRHRTALARTVQRVEHIERAFQKFAPLDVVERFAEGEQELEPRSCSVTVLFADLKGFTAMSERVAPALMIEMLNGYFRAMHAELSAHHGHLARIMGDGLLAVFGALDHNPWQTADAVRAALAMREALVRYNDELAPRGLPRLEFGVGIHVGEVVAGVMGSDRLREFSVIGDPVNTAARVESLTRTHGVDILVTGAVQAVLDDQFVLRPMPPVAVKGKTEPVATFAVESLRDRA